MLFVRLSFLSLCQMHNASRYFQKLIKEVPENHRDLVIADLRDFQMKLPPVN